MCIRIAAIEDEPGMYVFECPGCDCWHWINTNPDNGLPCWELTGTEQRPTVRNSVLINPANIPGTHRCHSIITDGLIEFLPDCTHGLVGQIVPLPPAL